MSASKRHQCSFVQRKTITYQHQDMRRSSSKCSIHFLNLMKKCMAVQIMELDVECYNFHLGYRYFYGELQQIFGWCDFQDVRPFLIQKQLFLWINEIKLCTGITSEKMTSNHIILSNKRETDGELDI